MRINPTKCVVGNTLRERAGHVVYVTEIRKNVTTKTGVECKVFFPSKAKRQRATWLDMDHLVPIIEERAYTQRDIEEFFNDEAKDEPIPFRQEELFREDDDGSPEG